MSQFQPYLMFDGNCEEAMRFYAKVLDAKIEMMMTFAESPPCEGMTEPLPEAMASKIMHSSISYEGSVLMASDMPPGQPYEGQKGVALALSYPTVQEGQRIFDLLAEGGTVTMPMTETFWSKSFGMLTDRFGTSWMINGQPLM